MIILTQIEGIQPEKAGGKCADYPKNSVFRGDFRKKRGWPAIVTKVSKGGAE